MTKTVHFGAHTMEHLSDDPRHRSRVPVFSWTDGVPFDNNARQQLYNVSTLPFVHHHVAVMPDVHWGMGATIGSVIPTAGAIIPAAVGVDIGCGMMATKLDGLTASRLPDDLAPIRHNIERTIPVGRQARQPDRWVMQSTGHLCESMVDWINERHPKLSRKPQKLKHTICSQAGTLGGGNHFIELCLDENDNVWVMLHSGSRGIGNQIGRYFIEKAKEDMRVHHINLPDADLAYVSEGTELYDDYVCAVQWAQTYAEYNRRIMMNDIVNQLLRTLPAFTVGETAVECHHNFVALENHFGKNVWITRKGAVRAREGDLAIIPGSMGAKSYIVKGRGNKDSFQSCSHGAGRVMSRTEARKTITQEEHIIATQGVECRKDEGVLDETPAAYKDIDAVMNAQKDLIEIVHTLKAVVCVKG